MELSVGSERKCCLPDFAVGPPFLGPSLDVLPGPVLGTWE